ncbi:uncharacterized protein LOC141628768 isoform X2 [Silene latifolia]|uniref:uncharacterized protein LOC141628768 isoform X2 n=1 Tax=Silene latifolia TaxID=37657 RepID=UPI003D7763D1
MLKLYGVPYVYGYYVITPRAFIVNLGDMLDRWSNMELHDLGNNQFKFPRTNSTSSSCFRFHYGTSEKNIFVLITRFRNNTSISLLDFIHNCHVANNVRAVFRICMIMISTHHPRERVQLCWH